jgi:hypothetical protein
MANLVLTVNGETPDGVLAKLAVTPVSAGLMKVAPACKNGPHVAPITKI